MTRRTMLLALGLVACGAPQATVIRRGAGPAAAGGGRLVVERLRFDALRIGGEPVASWSERSGAAARASLQAAEQLVEERFRDALARAGGEGEEGRAATSVRASLTRFDPGSFYLGGATVVEFEVELPRSGDALRLRCTAPASPLKPAPLTRAGNAADACARQLLDWLDR